MEIYEELPMTAKEENQLQQNDCYKHSSIDKESSSCDIMTGTKNSPPGENGSEKKRIVRPRVMMVVIAIAVCASIIGTYATIVGAYVEISKLRSEVASLQQASSDATSSLLGSDKSISPFVNATRVDLSALELKLDHIENSIDELEQESDQADQNIIRLLTTFSSCAEVLQQIPSSPSGYYYVRSSYGSRSAVRVYCDMTRSCGNITGGWMRVAQLDMTDNTTGVCPSDLMLNTTSIRRSCTIKSKSGACSSDTFLTFGIRYSQVCGQVIAYQVGSTNAFGKRSNSLTIDSNYADGVSLTHGSSPRQHIWTFAAAIDELSDAETTSRCPCTYIAESNPPPTPSFVENDYFCDTGAVSFEYGAFYSDDPLWDGSGCGPLNECCSFNNPPWFYKQLPQPTTDDIERRLCRNHDRGNEDIAIEKIDIYIQ